MPQTPSTLSLPRMTRWAIATVLLAVLVFFLAPAKAPVVLYKTGLVLQGAVLGYWIDRALFPYARPHAFMQNSLGQSLAMLRRCVIVLACILGLTLGL